MTELRRQIAAVRDFTTSEVVVIGDLILDEYVEGPVRRVSPEAPVQVVSVDRTFFRLGGAANVANLAATLGARARVAGCVGRDESGNTLRRLLGDAGIDAAAVVTALDRPTTRKLRVLSQHQQLVRLDWERSAPALPDVVGACERACEALGPRTSVVVSDYGKGVVGAAAMEKLVASARRQARPLLVDPKSRDFRIYSGATVLTPNLRELEDAVGRSLVDATGDEIAEVARTTIAQCGLEAVVVTLGHRGILVVPRAGAPLRVAAHAQEVFDVTGAGDAVIAMLALGLGQGLALEDAAAIANAAAGIVVGKIGTAVVQSAELIHALAPHLGKVIDRADLRGTVDALRAAGQRIVFTNGCFDLLHAGHLHLLREAARHGDVLIVGVNSDASVRRLKGASRPVVGDRDRAELVAALDCVSGSVIFEEDTPLSLIESILPDVLVKGADYAIDAVVGREVVEARGGRVELVPLHAGHSTTSLMEQVSKCGPEPSRS